MHRPPARCVPLFLVFLISVPVFAQEGRITVSAFAGPSVLSFSQVDEDGRKDIEVYNRNGIPVGSYDPLRTGWTFEGQVEYRFDRDLSMNVFGLYTRSTTGALLSDSAIYLSLDRKLTSTDIGIDFGFWFPPLVYDAEAGIFLGIGRMAGHAEQTTHQTHEQKSADSAITIIDQDAFAEYNKTKLYVRVGGRLTIPVFDRLGLSVQALYKFAPLGTMDGTLREFTLVRPHTTTIEFDFTTIDVKVGLSYVFD